MGLLLWGRGLDIGEGVGFEFVYPGLFWGFEVGEVGNGMGGREGGWCIGEQRLLDTLGVPLRKLSIRETSLVQITCFGK